MLLLKAQPHRAILVEPENMTAPSSIPDETRLHESDDLGAGDAEAESVQGWRERSIEAALVQPGDVLRVFPGAQASFPRAECVRCPSPPFPVCLARSSMCDARSRGR